MILGFYGSNIVRRSILFSTCFPRRFFNSLQMVEKTALIGQNMKWNEGLANKARSLIFGEKKYIELTPQEQKIVDFYQTIKSEQDAIILPNTRAALEQAEIEQMLLKRYKKT